MSGAFRLTVKDIFSLSGLGMAVTGIVESGTVRDGDPLVLLSDGIRIPVKVLQIEIFAKRIPEASAGPEEVAIVLSGVTRRDLAAGQVLQSP